MPWQLFLGNGEGWFAVKGGHMFFIDHDNDSKRILGIRDKQILYRNAKGKCQNPPSNGKIDFDEMQVGHKIAWSRGGKTILNNSVCIADVINSKE